mmetsp:Transcript_33225/g.98962  ORF Transcript_33225/g.98962 Transcript_33225/m.98962 type:complete len:203 (-) Transcript_33225:1687-2295(-)
MMCLALTSNASAPGSRTGGCAVPAARALTAHAQVARQCAASLHRLAGRRLGTPTLSASLRLRSADLAWPVAMRRTRQMTGALTPGRSSRICMMGHPRWRYQNRIALPWVMTCWARLGARTRPPAVSPRVCRTKMLAQGWTTRRRQTVTTLDSADLPMMAHACCLARRSWLTGTPYLHQVECLSPTAITSSSEPTARPSTAPA